MAAPDLTLDEVKAVRSLERLAKRWPSKDLRLFSFSGSLIVTKRCLDTDREYVVGSINGIGNDGGDPGVDFDSDGDEYLGC